MSISNIDLHIDLIDKNGETMNKSTPKISDVPKRINPEQMKNWISNSGLDEETKKELVKKISEYPSNTLSHFYKNIRKHIKRIRQERKKD